ncbi:hypothetical protein J4407_03230 [Candidatus Pacearchaeota archaeon]|nr:hypothetical protein [Candidatus Pacearchaeota archaeon]
MVRKKTKKEKSEKDVSRREFLARASYGGRILAVSGIYGTAGNIAGQVYRVGRDAYRNVTGSINTAVDTIENAAENVTNFFLRREETPAIQEIPETISRRGFFDYFQNLAHENPVTSGTIIGAGYGAGKQTIKSVEAHRQKMLLLEDQKERIRDKKEREKLSTQISELTEEIAKLKKNPSSLEEKSKSQMMLIIGSMGVITTIFFLASYMTGFSVYEQNSFDYETITILVLLISLLLIFIGAKRETLKNSFPN